MSPPCVRFTAFALHPSRGGGLFYLFQTTSVMNIKITCKGADSERYWHPLKETTMTNVSVQYKAHQMSIRELIAQLESHLTKHEAKACAAPSNWGYTGDLGHVEGDLKELVAFFGS